MSPKIQDFTAFLKDNNLLFWFALSLTFIALILIFAGNFLNDCSMTNCLLVISLYRSFVGRQNIGRHKMATGDLAGPCHTTFLI